MIFLKLLSLLPLRVLYIFSDILYILTFYVFKYRKKVIVENLRKAFPDKSGSEIHAITKKFYRNLTDIVVEILKTLSLSEKELSKRTSFSNTEVPLKFTSKNQNFIVLTGHLCNWEWLLSTCMVKFKYPIDGVYKPLNSKFSDRLMLKIRSKFGANPVTMNDTLREQIRKKNIPHVLAMVADQTPLKNEIQYWTNFFHQETPYYVGADKISKMLNMPVLFVGMRRIKRGYYEIYFREISSEVNPNNEFPITERFNQILEEEITKNPETWLWSHRRWKHRRV